MTTARRWVVRLRSGDVGRADVAALNRWRAESTEHRRAFALANAQWQLLQQAAGNVVAAEPKVAPTRRAWIGGALAASVGGAVYLAARPPLDLWPSISELRADYRTDVGEQRQIRLGDNVSVELNTRTSVSAGGADAVTLIGGEIAVTTGRSATLQRPFVVSAGAGRVSATRAMFDLRREGEVVAVMCLDGDVAIECGSQTATLKAGQHLDYGPSGLGDIRPSDGHVVEAWRNGLLVFENRPLSDVITEINRYRRGWIVLARTNAGHLPLDATFRLDRIDEIVPKLAQFFGLKVRTLPGGVVLLS